MPPSPLPPKISWAERHAPLATIIAAYSTLAAVLIAGVGYYFTVIPLYQKAAVDEQLAKREAELRSVDERLVLARQQAYELGRARLMDSFALRASWDCGIGPGQTPLQMNEAGIPKLNDRGTFEERLAPSIAECLSGFTQQAENSKRLTDADLQKLREATTKLGAELDQNRLKVLERIREIPGRARLDERVLDAATIDTRAQEIVERAAVYWTPEQRARSKERWFLSRVESVQRGIVYKHWTDTGKAVGDLYRTGVWPRLSVME